MPLDKSILADGLTQLFGGPGGSLPEELTEAGERLTEIWVDYYGTGSVAGAPPVIEDPQQEALEAACIAACGAGAAPAFATAYLGGITAFVTIVPFGGMVQSAPKYATLQASLTALLSVPAGDAEAKAQALAGMLHRATTGAAVSGPSASGVIS
ncbi:MAG: hypothetical protein ACQEVA_01015 [Myxococcota bacterium]